MKHFFVFMCALFTTTASGAIVCNPGFYSGGDECWPCPSDYPHSDAGATGPHDCFLTTDAGKYVKNTGGDQENCPIDSYCPGGIKVYFLPYIFVDYITTSDDAYINTRLPVSFNGYKIKTKMALNTLSTIFGSYYGVVNGVFQRYYAGMVINRFEIAWFDKFPMDYNYSSYVDNQPHIFDIVFKNGEQTISIDGTQVLSYSNTVDESKISTQFLLPAAKNATLYNMTWYDGSTNELLRNFIPAFDAENNTYGVYDTVSNTFFGNGKWDALTYNDTYNERPQEPPEIPSDGMGEITGPSVGTVPTNPTTGGIKIGDICTSGVTKLHAGQYTFTVYKDKLTSPSVHIRAPNGDICYVNLVIGAGHLNIRVDDTVYHAVN